MKLLLLALLVVSSCAAPLQDELERLPGYDSKLPSRMFSGFIPAGNSQENGINYEMFEHYFFVEAEVENPAEAPVVIWTNGGPGASSFFGLFVLLLFLCH